MNPTSSREAPRVERRYDPVSAAASHSLVVVTWKMRTGRDYRRPRRDEIRGEKVVPHLIRLPLLLHSSEVYVLATGRPPLDPCQGGSP